MDGKMLEDDDFEVKMPKGLTGGNLDLEGMQMPRWARRA
jgi:hypothetical protein